MWYWSSLTDARHLLADHARELVDARRGLEPFPTAATLLNEARALAALGQVDEVSARSQSADLPTHPTTTPGDVMEVAALELRAHGHVEAGEAAVERALRWYRGRPAGERRTEGQRFALARNLYLAERWADASAAFERLAADSGPPRVLGYLGVLAARRGERAQAERISDSLAAFQVPYIRGAHTPGCARIAAVLGQRERAVALLGDTFRQGQVYGPRASTRSSTSSPYGTIDPTLS